MPRRASRRDGPHPVDAHVAKRLKDRRVLRGMSQEKLAEIIDISYQLVQKRENGFNRLSAASLYETAQALSTPVAYFFEGLATAPVTADDLVFTCKPAMEAARLIYRMDAITGQLLVQFLRRFVGTKNPREVLDQVAAREPEVVG